MNGLRPFRPRAARWVAWVLFALIWTAVAALLVSSFTRLEQFGWEDRALTVLFAAAGSLVVQRQARVRAVPTPQGLTVHNLFVTTTVEWAQILRVTFDHGHPWVQLDLADGDTLAVMAIQGADGEYGRREAQRLADLVHRLGEAPDR